MSPDFGGYPSSSEAGFPGMMSQLGHMGLGSDMETMNAMNSAFGPDAGGASSFGGFGGASSNFMPSESYSPFMGAPSMMSGAGMAGGYEQFPEAAERYPMHDEEMPRAYPMGARSRPRFRQPVVQPVFEPQGAEEGTTGDQGPSQYEQGSADQEEPQGYTGSQNTGQEEQQEYGRQPEGDGQQGYQEAPQETRGSGYQTTGYPTSQSYYEK